MRTLKRKISKINSDIEQLEKTIAESQKRLAELKREKIDAENAEIISLVRDANLSVDDIGKLVSEYMTTTTKKSSETENLFNSKPDNNILKGSGN